MNVTLLKTGMTNLGWRNKFALFHRHNRLIMNENFSARVEGIDRADEPLWPWFARSNCPECDAAPGQAHMTALCPVIVNAGATALASPGTSEIDRSVVSLNILNDPFWPRSAAGNCPACGAPPGRPHLDPFCQVIRKPDDTNRRSYTF